MNLPDFEKERPIPMNRRLVSRLYSTSVIHQLTKAKLEHICTIFTFHHHGIGHLQINTNYRGNHYLLHILYIVFA